MVQATIPPQSFAQIVAKPCKRLVFPAENNSLRRISFAPNVERRSNKIGYILYNVQAKSAERQGWRSALSYFTIKIGRIADFFKQCALFYLDFKPSLRFHCFFDSNCASNRHTNHGVVTSTDQAHHFYVSGNGGRTCELCVGVHSTHRIGHTVGCKANNYIIGVGCKWSKATHPKIILLLV